MPPRSKVDLLPQDLRDELGRRLIGSAFSGYEEHSAWLAENGYEIKKSALGNWGKGFEDRCKALKVVTEQARAIVAESPDDDNSVNDALIRLSQEKCFTVLWDMKIDPEAIDLPKLMRAIAELGRASMQQKKWSAEREAAARTAALKDAAGRVEEAARAQGMDDTQARFWREKVLSAV